MQYQYQINHNMINPQVLNQQAAPNSQQQQNYLSPFGLRFQPQNNNIRQKFIHASPLQKQSHPNIQNPVQNQQGPYWNQQQQQNQYQSPAYKSPSVKKVQQTPNSNISQFQDKMAQLMQECENLQGNIIDSDALRSENLILKNELQTSNREIVNLKQQLDELQKNQKTDPNIVKRYEQQMEKLLFENQRLNEEIIRIIDHQKVPQQGQLEYNELVQEFNKLVQKLEIQKSETTYWNGLYLQQISDSNTSFPVYHEEKLNQIEQENKALQQNITQLSRENLNLQQQLKQKQQTNDQSKFSNISQLENKIKELTDQNNNLTNILEEKLEEIDAYKILESKLDPLLESNEKFARIIEEKDKEINNLKSIQKK